MEIQQFLQVLNFFPQIVDFLKKMGEKEKAEFVSKLDLNETERENALRILSCFQKGEALNEQEQKAAQELLLKAVDMNDLKIAELFQLALFK